MILLTGVSGFIGQHLLKELALVYGTEDLVLLTSKPVAGFRYILHNNYSFSKSDFKDYAITKVIHAGAFTPKSGSEANDILKSNSNITNTEHLLANLPESVETVVLLSTLDVYQPSNDAINEQSLVAPISLYGNSKLYTEKMLEAWAVQNNKNIQILRIGHIYGPGEDAYRKIIPETFKAILKGNAPVVYTNGKEKRSFLYIGDCCNYIINSLNLEGYAGPINVVSAQAYSVIDIVRKIVDISKTGIAVNVLNNNVETRDVIFDDSLLVKLLGKPLTSLDDGFAQEWEYFKLIESHKE